MIYELREYHAVEGKEELLHQRFREETLPLFDKHKIEVTGFWTRQDFPYILIYVCRFENEEQQKQAWQAFGSDPDWKRVKTQSEIDGPLTTYMSSYLLQPVSYFKE